MSKRKTVAGYVDSSDDESSVPVGQKKPKAASHLLPCLTTSARAISNGFQLPSLSARFPRGSAPPTRYPSVSSTSSRLTPAPNATPSLRNTPEIPTDQVQGPNIAVESHASSTALLQEAIEPGPAPALNASRSTLAWERQLNELNDGFEDFRRTSEQRQAVTDNTLSLILDAIHRLESAPSTSAGHALNAASSEVSPLPATVPYLSNPTPSPELVATVSKVVSEARTRVGNKKTGAEYNSCKEHARLTFYRMLKISAAQEIGPYFEDVYGEPDTLPSQFVDPVTGYCQPYPHWKIYDHKRPKQLIGDVTRSDGRGDCDLVE